MIDINSDFAAYIYEKYNGLMFKVAFDVLQNKEDAEDVLQCTIEKILLKPELFSNLHSVKTKNLITTMTTNTAIDFYRKRSINQEREVHFEDAINLPSIEITTHHENDICIALNELPESYKNILMLKYSFGYKLGEIANMLGIAEPNARKRISRARKHLKKGLKKVGMMILCLLALTLSGIAVDAATDGKFFTAMKKLFGVEMVTDDNKNKIGKETELDPFVFHQEDIKISEAEHLSNSQIINSVKDKAYLPLFVSDIKTQDNMTSEFIIKINACTVLYQEEYNGWYCKQGDTLCFDFSKYALETNKPQKLIVGYVLDGVMYEGIEFDSLKGGYQLEIKEDGEYYIYLVNMDMNYLSIKSGTVSIIKKE